MQSVSRRQFLKKSGQTGLTACATATLGRLGFAQSDGTTRVVIDSARQIAPIDRHLFGSFLEHLGRAIYEGIYDPDSKFADANGFRTDVMKEVRDLGVPIVRYPGGNFVSGYHWLDGVGPKKDRPTVLDRAWNTLETNQFGTNEFITWARAVGTEPLFGLNFGTGIGGRCGGAGGVLQRGQGNEVERSAARARIRAAAQREVLVRGQRDGRSVADRAHAGARIWDQSDGRRAADARNRSDDQADRVRIERAVHADLYRLGPHRAGRVL